MKTAAAFALLLAAPALAQSPPDLPAIVALQPIYITRDETVFVDTRSLVRNGDWVEGWDLNIYAKPTSVAGHSTEVHWTRFRMSCSRMSVTVSWVIGRNFVLTTFKERLDLTLAVDADTGWDQTHEHMCGSRGSLFNGTPWTSESSAIAQARMEMARK